MDRRCHVLVLFVASRAGCTVPIRGSSAVLNLRPSPSQPVTSDSEKPHFGEPAPDLAEETIGDAVTADCRATSLTLRQHPLALLRPALA